MPAEQNPQGLAGSARAAQATHRFTDARAAALRLRTLLPGRALPWQVLGDAELELGDVAGADRAYAEMARIDDDESAAADARLARAAFMRGRLDEARTRLESALALARAAVPSAPEVVVWCRVQLGELAFKRGDLDAAEAHYRAALAVAPEHWSVLEHLAEVEGARGRDAEAVALYERVLARVPRPELWQALGDLHGYLRRLRKADECYDRALAGYRASIANGEVLYVHHLAGFFADSRPDAAEAVAWARRDLELRRTVYAWDALGWALYKQGDVTAALAAARKSLATGIADSHLLYHAAMIHMSAGEIAEGQALLERAAAVNPRLNAFHAHR